MFNTLTKALCGIVSIIQVIPSFFVFNKPLEIPSYIPLFSQCIIYCTMQLYAHAYELRDLYIYIHLPPFYIKTKKKNNNNKNKTKSLFNHSIPIYLKRLKLVFDILF